MDDETSISNEAWSQLSKDIDNEYRHYKGFTFDRSPQGGMFVAAKSGNRECYLRLWFEENSLVRWVLTGSETIEGWLAPVKERGSLMYRQTDTNRKISVKRTAAFLMRKVRTCMEPD